MIPKGQTAYPHPSSPAVTAVMRGNKKVDTRPERLVRSHLHRAGFRFRKNQALIVDGRRCRPDIVFPTERVAVFIDGCFWHGCPAHGTTPRVNQPYWSEKLSRNRERDALDTQALEKDGWEVVRIWEHLPVDEATILVSSAVLNRR